jgi:hypothetical protein
MHTVEGRTDLVKDPNTGAIINIDDAAHRSAVTSSKAREKAKLLLNNNTEEINKLNKVVLGINKREEVINSIKEEVSEIKLMMKQLLKRFDDNGR